VATKPTIASVAIGAKVSAALWNAQVYNLGRFVDVTKPVTQLTQGAVQSVANNTWTAITFDTEVLDTDNQHSIVSNTSRVVIGGTLGWYRCSGTIPWTGSATGARYGAKLQLNGVDVNGSQNFSANYSSSINLSSTLSPILVQATVATDYVELLGFQISTVAMNTQVTAALRPSFVVEYVGTLA
jgi:hypothetical protein